mmetsp:Transcript_10406/g.24275  ORF Transcript_10406/g.24275 Transcript_10406/m.24275 type:complete len:228 (-) Transcript_10406:8-691(-)
MGFACLLFLRVFPLLPRHGLLEGPALAHHALRGPVGRAHAADRRPAAGAPRLKLPRSFLLSGCSAICLVCGTLGPSLNGSSPLRLPLHIDHKTPAPSAPRAPLVSCLLDGWTCVLSPCCPFPYPVSSYLRQQPFALLRVLFGTISPRASWTRAVSHPSTPLCTFLILWWSGGCSSRAFAQPIVGGVVRPTSPPSCSTPDLGVLVPSAKHHPVQWYHRINEDRPQGWS